MKNRFDESSSRFFLFVVFVNCNPDIVASFKDKPAGLVQFEICPDILGVGFPELCDIICNVGNRLGNSWRHAQIFIYYILDFLGVDI